MSKSSARVATAPRQSRAAAPRKPTPPSQKPRRAKASDLGDERAYVPDVLLEDRNLLVDVRQLDQLDVAELEVLPALTEYMKLLSEVTKIADEEARTERAKAIDEETPPDLRKQRAKLYAMWQFRVAHLGVLANRSKLTDVPCEDPDCDVDAHPPSLWTVRLVRRLSIGDIQTVLTTALGGQLAARAIPFSSGPTPSATPPVASTGESTPA